MKTNCAKSVQIRGNPLKNMEIGSNSVQKHQKCCVAIIVFYAFAILVDSRKSRNIGSREGRGRVEGGSGRVQAGSVGNPMPLEPTLIKDSI